MEKRVSIIVPVYNAEKYLERCIDSILNQSYTNIELILINDGSTDNSEKICKSYENKYKNVKYIYQRNSGPSNARNLGIINSTGDYIQFVDSDDYIERDMTLQLVNTIEKGVDCVISGYKFFYMDIGDVKLKYKIPNKSGIMNKNEFMSLFLDYYKNDLINSICNKLYSAEKIKNNKIFFDPKIRVGEDLIFNLKYLNVCKKIGVVKYPMYNYIALGSDSLTRNFKENLFQTQKYLYKNLIKFIEENDLLSNDNLTLLDLLYFNAVIACFENVVNGKNKLTIQEKIREIKIIASDETVIDLANKYKNKTCSLQKKIISMMIDYKFYRNILYFFMVKDFLRKKFTNIYKIVRKIEN